MVRIETPTKKAIKIMNETNNNDDAFLAKRNNVSYFYAMSEI